MKTPKRKHQVSFYAWSLEKAVRCCKLCAVMHNDKDFPDSFCVAEEYGSTRVRPNMPRPEIKVAHVQQLLDASLKMKDIASELHVSLFQGVAVLKLILPSRLEFLQVWLLCRSHPKICINPGKCRQRVLSRSCKKFCKFCKMCAREECGTLTQQV